MLLLALMLQSVTQPPARISHVRTTRPISRPVRRMHLMPDCRLDASCTRADPNRLITDTELREDPKQVALRGTWQNCGITGMPVCPARGRQVLRANLGN